ncbi:trypsin [Herbihabitans rhizosphaerae]|uniref:Trypsin n=1 Tax=Herbihabitans rhizosphaerae TaxID=1872711 RepID=A0A4Q7KX00_9PSEU|nr:trypsin-like serine protease [Herbihabitans rhizosphaerae]RZS41235.1 trypsin [Herbihabitans rhizosphaerae]
MRYKRLLGAVAGVAVAASLGLTVAAEAVVGGQPAAEAPSWMGSLQYKTNTGEFTHGCGASLIAPEWAVTARHCVIQGANTVDVVKDIPIDPALMRLRLGSADRTGGGTMIAIAEVKRPAPNPIPTAGTDIALLRLAAPVGNAPIRIAADGAATGPTRVLGWGMDCAGKQCPLPVMLNQLDTRTIGDIDCALLAVHFTVENCVGEWNTGRGSHFGDSGGPAAREVNGEWQLTGAASRVMNAGNAPAIYVDVPAWRQWIRQTTGINSL